MGSNQDKISKLEFIKCPSVNTLDYDVIRPGRVPPFNKFVTVRQTGSKISFHDVAKDRIYAGLELKTLPETGRMATGFGWIDDHTKREPLVKWLKRAAVEDGKRYDPFFAYSVFLHLTGNRKHLLAVELEQ